MPKKWYFRLCFVWSLRNFVFVAVQNEIKSKFSNSKLGLAWTIINPLTQVLIYTTILSNVISLKIPGMESRYAFAIYLVSGLLVWTLFTEIVTRLTSMFIESGPYLKKVNFPKIRMPLTIITACLFNHILLFFCASVIVFIVGQGFDFSVFWLLPLAFITVLLAVGLGMLASIFAVFVRDTVFAVPIILQIWFWLTPIVYPIEILPKSLQAIIIFNPLYPLVSGYQKILLTQETPSEIFPLLLIVTISILLQYACMNVFQRARAEIMDSI